MYSSLLFLSLFFLSLFCAPVVSTGMEDQPPQAEAPAIEPMPKQARPELKFVFLTTDNRCDLFIQGDAPFEKWDSFAMDSPPRLVLDIPNASFRRDYQKLKVNRPELKSICIAEHKDKVRFVFDLSANENVHHEIKKEPDGLRVIVELPAESKPPSEIAAVQPQEMEQAVAQPEEKEQVAVQPEKMEQAASQPQQQEQAAAPPREKEQVPGELEKTEQPPLVPHETKEAAIQPQKTEQPPSPPPQAVPKVQAPGAPIEMNKTYKGKKITVSINNASLRDFITVVSQMSGTKIELAPDINEKLTLILQGVPWDQALEMVTNYYGLKQEEREGILYLTRPEKGLKN